MELNNEQAKRHAKVLLEANEAWFYDYAWTEADEQRYENALAFFEYYKHDLKKKAEVK